MKNTFIFLWHLLLLFPLLGNAQNISFNHLTTDDGLSHNTVISIYQDERDFLWFATRNGLSLYNGKRFKVYQNEKGNPNSLQYNDLYQVTGDKKGHIYIRSNRGVSEYDIHEGTFKHLTSQNTRAAFFADSLYLATHNRIYKYNGEKLSLIYQMPSQTASISCLHVQNDSILIGTSRGLYRLVDGQKLQQLTTYGNISDIYRDSRGKSWIATRSGHGCLVLDGDKITLFTYDPNDTESVSSNFTHKICEDQAGNIWIGTFNGLNKYDYQTGKFKSYAKQENKNGLSYSSIWSLYCDHQGNIWAGTYFGGVNYFHPQKQKFREYQFSSNEKQGLSSPIVSCITEDNQGNLWIGTEGGGINCYQPTTQSYKHFTLKKSSTRNIRNNIKALYFDSKREELWMSIHLGGIYKLMPKTGELIWYNAQKGYKNSSLLDNTVCILPYNDKLLLATNQGIGEFNPITKECKLFFEDKDIRNRTMDSKKLMIDHQGVLWIAGNNNGVCAYHFKTQKLKSYRSSHAIANSLSSNSINNIVEDDHNRLWFCTNENGLDLYNHENDTFENFDINGNGLASNVVYDLCQLSDDRLLVTTDKGFSTLDPLTKQFKNYHQLPLSCLNENALFRNSKGEIFIGGTQGAISFYEHNLDELSCSYQILPYRLTVNGKKVEVNDDTKILKQDISFTKSITLNSKQNIFSLDYTTTNYMPHNKRDIIYYLEGFSNQWNKLEGSAITYSNLKPGKYVLTLQEEGIDANNVQPSRLVINVLPPFYRSILAYFIYLFVFITVIYIIIVNYRKNIKMQEAIKYEKKHAEDIEQMNQTKMRFFTNISHEFRTPLSLIIGQIEILLTYKLTSEVYNKILGTYKSCIQLKELITELLDFQKQEHGHTTIKVAEYNIVNFVYEHYQLFAEYAKLHQISFTFEKSSDDIRVWYNAKQMQKVMNNLISNAFNHTKDGGQISLSIRKRNQEVILEVTDTGSGIATKDLNKIFDLFYQTEQLNSLTNASSGIGLALTKGIIDLHHGVIEVLSEEGEGTTFRIYLKTDNIHFTPDQLCIEQHDEIQTDIDKEEYQRWQDLLNKQEVEEIITQEVEAKEKYKIVIVEDNTSLRNMLVSIFKSFYTVITASNGKEGLEKIRSEHPNIVISDIVMPEMSGTELCQIMKKDLDICHIPIVLLTAKTAIEHNIEGLKIGADDYITKPFNINILLSRCNNLVNNRIILQEKFSNQPQTNMQILATNALDKAFLDNAMSIIENEIDNASFTIDQLALEMNIARTKLYTKFKVVTGQTPGDLLMTIRLKRAAFLLRNNPELNISEISDRTGFNIPKYFSKCFKEKYHVTPQAYRKDPNIYSEEEIK